MSQLQPLSQGAAQRRVSVIVPAYQEAENFPELVERVGVSRESFDDLELIVVDDNSSDGTEEILKELSEKHEWLRYVIRRTERGLSTAVMAGLDQARFEYLVVIDADLSHPPEKISEMVEKLSRSSMDMVFGSRFTSGGSVQDDWSLFRWLNSFVAASFARPFTRIKDPMSGFFLIRKRDYDACRGDLSPIGYKIGLELLVKSSATRVGEVPIHFADRKRGESKLSLKEQVNYLRHIRRLANHKYGFWSYLAQFGLVGASGTLVNLASLTLFQFAGLSLWLAVALAIWMSMTSNFFLNYFVTFNYARGQGSFVLRYLGFVGSCSLGALINYSITMSLIASFNAMQQFPQLAAVVGILGAMGFNFVLNRYWVFRQS